MCGPDTLKRKTTPVTDSVQEMMQYFSNSCLNSNWTTFTTKEHSLAFIMFFVNKNVSLQSYDKFSNFTAILVDPLSRNTARQLVADVDVIFLMICKRIGLVSTLSLISNDRENCIDHTLALLFNLILMLVMLGNGSHGSCSMGIVAARLRTIAIRCYIFFGDDASDVDMIMMGPSLSVLLDVSVFHAYKLAIFFV